MNYDKYMLDIFGDELSVLRLWELHKITPFPFIQQLVGKWCKNI